MIYRLRDIYERYRGKAEAKANESKNYPPNTQRKTRKIIHLINLDQIREDLEDRIKAYQGV